MRRETIHFKKACKITSAPELILMKSKRGCEIRFLFWEAIQHKDSWISSATSTLDSFSAEEVADITSACDCARRIWESSKPKMETDCKVPIITRAQRFQCKHLLTGRLTQHWAIKAGENAQAKSPEGVSMRSKERRCNPSTLVCVFAGIRSRFRRILFHKEFETKLGFIENSTHCRQEGKFKPAVHPSMGFKTTNTSS